MSRQNRAYTMPSWLWFFLLLPIVLIVALIYRSKRWAGHGPRRFAPPLAPRLARRYVEPDSIPLNLHKQPAINFDQEIPFETGYETFTEAKEPVVIIETEIPPEMLEPLEMAVPAESVVSTAAGEVVFDDLKIIEGIGPKIAGLLRESGITSFQQLAAAPEGRLVEILTQAKLNRLANPGTWAEQARLAADGQWEALAALQDTLKGGRRVSRG